MTASRRYFFPYIYLVLLLPLAVSLPVFVKATLLAVCLGLALAIRRDVARNLAPAILASLTTMIPLLIVVQSAVCSSSGLTTLPEFDCVKERSIEVLLKLGIGIAVLVLAASNEWRGSLLETSNAMWLPRSVRVMIVIAGVMVGEFRKATIRVQHAFAARGDVAPSFHWRNVIALPRMLGCVWASVLKLSAERINTQWSSPAFWDKYVPAGHELAGSGAKMSAADAVVITAGGTALTLTALSLVVR